MVLDQGVTTLIFDFDGTLFDLPVDYAALRRDLGLADHEKLGPMYQRYLDEGDEASLAVVTRHECAAAREGSFTPGAPDCLSSPGNVAIVTRNSREAVRIALGELADRVFVVGREDVRRLKPDPEGLTTVLTRFDAVADAAVLVGDTYHDVEAARAAGMRSVIVRNPALRYAPAGADVYVEDLTEVSRSRISPPRFPDNARQ
jgi:phosphoglycolate phosphatase